MLTGAVVGALVGAAVGADVTATARANCTLCWLMLYSAHIVSVVLATMYDDPFSMGTLGGVITKPLQLLG